MKSEFDDIFPNKDLSANKYVTLFSFFHNTEHEMKGFKFS